MRDISTALTALDPAELKQVKSQCEGLLNAQPNGAESTLVEADMHRRFGLILSGVGMNCAPYGAMRKSAHYSSFKDGVQMFHNYIVTFLKPKSHVEKEKCVVVLLQMLQRRVERDGHGLNHRTLSNALQRVSNIVDDQFPGYRESGLLPMIISSARII